jgi:phospholipid transport system substrate-binding protein
MAYKRQRAVSAALMIAASSFSITVLSPSAVAQSASAAPAPSAAAAQIPATTVIQNFADTLVGVMKQATTLGYEGRYAKLDPAIRHAFNVPLMTKIVVGPAWTGWTQAQRDSITDAFTKFIIATYARRFDGFSGESFVVDGSQSGGTGMVVQSHLVRPNDTPVTINYLMRQSASNGGAWKIVDVFLTGSISELATRRSEFSAVLDRGGYNGLLAELQAKAKPDGTD